MTHRYRCIGLSLAILTAGTAGAEPFCKPDAAELAGLSATLAGAWQGELVQGVTVLMGHPQAIPANPTPLPATVSATEGGLRLADAKKPEAWDLAATSGDADFALPGETPLGTEELLAPLLAEAGITCPALDLPQFQAALPETQGMAGTIHLYALSGSAMLMVFLFNERTEPRQNGVRAVLRYRR